MKRKQRKGMLMTQRRTIGSAMTITPDKLAFIGGNAVPKEPEPEAAGRSVGLDGVVEV